MFLKKSAHNSDLKNQNESRMLIIKSQQKLQNSFQLSIGNVCFYNQKDVALGVIKHDSKIIVLVIKKRTIYQVIFC